MKTLLLATLMTFSALTSSKVMADITTRTEFKGSSDIQLTYLGVGWRNGCVDISTPVLGGVAGGFLGVGESSLAMTAASAGVAFVGVGAVMLILCSDFEKVKTDTFDIKLYASLTETSTDRVSLKIHSDKKKGCGGFTINAIGESDGFGNYEIFATKEDYLANKSMGTMTKLEKGLAINISENITALTKGKKGYDCRWDMERGLDVELK